MNRHPRTTVKQKTGGQARASRSRVRLACCERYPCAIYDPLILNSSTADSSGLDDSLFPISSPSLTPTQMIAAMTVAQPAKK